MTPQFFSQLSQNFIGILDDDKYHDVTIEVGQDSEVKIFRAHMVILNYRSEYFRRNLSAKDDNILVHTKLPNISPNIFQIILKLSYLIIKLLYIYKIKLIYFYKFIDIFMVVFLSWMKLKL